MQARLLEQFAVAATHVAAIWSCPRSGRGCVGPMCH